MIMSQGLPLQLPSTNHVLITDASMCVWGAVCGSVLTRGVWSSDQASRNIIFLKLETVFLTSAR